jgi:23S rRNA (cytosine1962-C5)-methyltransferase
MATVKLIKKRKDRLEQGHPWIFKNEIETIEGTYEPGDLVQVKDHLGRALAVGYINPKSQITVRVVSYASLEAMDEAFFKQRLQIAWEHRQRFLEDPASCRLVHGEADFLPGLVVDKFEDTLVIQILTLGMELRRDAIIQALKDVLSPKGIYERSDVAVRELEGLEQRKGILYGECPKHITILENGLKIEVDIEEGQKTGYFFDQRENRAALEPLVKGWGSRSGIHLEEREQEGIVKKVPVNANGKEVTFPYWDGATVLECFAHTGSFTLHACKYGAKRVTCLDVSEHAISSARHNVELNEFGDRVEFVVADAFQYLREQVKGQEERLRRAQADAKVDTSVPLKSEGRTWDVVILDPPAFAKNRGAVTGACRGYKDINLHALKLINEGGYLVTASCSYHVRPDVFIQTIQDAAMDAGKLLRMIDFKAAGKDHPHILGVDEGNYLKYAIFEVRDLI